MSASDDPRVPLAEKRTSLAFERNRWAAERTLMAWIRTSIAMVTFGFAVDRFVAYLSGQGDDAKLGTGHHWYGLILVVVGVILLILAVVEHFLILRRMSRDRGIKPSGFSLPLFAACLILVLGVATMFLILASGDLDGGAANSSGLADSFGFGTE